MKPRTILLLVLMIFACVLGVALGNFGAGITLPIAGQSVTFKVYIPPVSLPAELLLQPAVDIGGLKVGLYNTLFTTIIVDIVIVVLAILGRRGLGDRPKNWIANAWEGLVELLYSKCIVPILGARATVVLPLAVTVFAFMTIAGVFELLPGYESIGLAQHMATGGFCSVNVAGVVWTTGVPVNTNLAQDCRAPPATAGGVRVAPFLRLPTTDVSTMLALALIAFFFVEFQGVRANGWGHFRHVFRFRVLRQAVSAGLRALSPGRLGAVGRRLLSQFVCVVSFLFQHVGNMFAGSILLIAMAFVLPLVFPTLFLALEFAIAILEAFVFTMLIVVFTSLAVAHTDY